ncbi:hypothetical protein Q8A73_007095 [Channa argus]|nr:hypothetical protein Q8A73_007095 [Channa argus]
MRRVHTFSAMILLAALFMILYITLNLETASVPKAVRNDLHQQSSLWGQKNDVKTQSSTHESTTTPKPDVYNVSVSDVFRQSIPQNGAYWNRLMHSALRELDKGGNTFRHASSWPLCRENNQESLQTNVHDFTSYPFLFQNFLQVMNCRSPPVLFNQPNKCITSEGGGAVPIFLLLAIKSVPGNFERRQAVRETWGREVHQGGLQVRTVFLLGTSPQDHPDLSLLLSFEAQQFGDVLQWDFDESLLNLTLKMNMFLQWTLKHCPHVSFVFSGDDDVFMNTPALLKYLQSQEVSSKAPQLYVGQIITKGSPMRDPNNKYYIPLSFFDGPYPAYAGGGGFLYSGALLQPLYSLLSVIPFFPIDDVYAGMCFNALGVSPELHPGFKTFDIKDHDRQNLCIHKDLLLIHQRSPSQIKTLWKGIHNPLLTC